MTPGKNLGLPEGVFCGAGMESKSWAVVRVRVHGAEILPEIPEKCPKN